MKIVLGEDRNGQLVGERTFTSEIVLVGRDPAVCHYFFDQSKWPMVSRKHAEFRLREGRCVLADANSRFGTLVNGQKITGPVEVRVGARIQLGANGPVLRVVSLEQTPAERVDQRPSDLGRLETFRDSRGASAQPGTPSATPRTPTPQANADPDITHRIPDAPPPVRPATPQAFGQMAAIEIISSAPGRGRRIPLNKEVIRLGRDPDGEVVIDAAGAVVSRKHAEIHKRGPQFVLVDLKSFNGTLLNNQRVADAAELYDGDQIQLGMGGPLLRVIDPAHPAPPQRLAARGGSPSAPLPQAPIPSAFGQIAEIARRQTIVAGASSPAADRTTVRPNPQLLAQRSFEDRPQLSIGRAPDNDIRLDGLQISNHHARFARHNGSVSVEDAGSTNGVYVNGQRISGRRPVQLSDVIQIGPFVLQADAGQGIAVYDTRSKTRIDAINIVKIVTNRSGGGTIRLLDDVGLTVQPNEFVGLLGPSGAGKSTLMDSLNGMRPATSGAVLINNLDLYRHLDSLKQSIGYVPQDDIIHRELTVYRTLYYVARLRLSRDVSGREIDQIVNEVMDVTGLSERRDVPVGQLSGGQRKRVSIAVELIP